MSKLKKREKGEGLEGGEESGKKKSEKDGEEGKGWDVRFFRLFWVCKIDVCVHIHV